MTSASPTTFPACHGTDGRHRVTDVSPRTHAVKKVKTKVRAFAIGATRETSNAFSRTVKRTDPLWLMTNGTMYCG